jgi:hypothetical protein
MLLIPKKLSKARKKKKVKKPRRTARTVRGRKQKGRNAVALVRDLLLRAYNLEEDDIHIKATSQGGCDVHMSPHALSWFPFAIEVKCQEKLSLWAALEQATKNAKKRKYPPVVFFKRAHGPLYVTFRADELLQHIKETYVEVPK